MKILITGGGGLIGGHLAKSLIADGHTVRVVDIKPICEWYQHFDEAENIMLNLSVKENCDQAVKGIDEIYNLACNMGGIGFIENHKSACMFSVLINTNLLYSAIQSGVSKYFFSSTACVYNTLKQSTTSVIALKEEDAYPALPEEGYGWEKLFSEQLCLSVAKENLIQVRIARFHNVYGPYGAWTGGREKSPAALCRKISLVKLNKSNFIEIWGNGNQMRSYMYVDDCIDGIKRIMKSQIKEPINLGSSELVSINHLVKTIEDIAGVKVEKKYNSSAPIGVMGRNSDNTKIKEYLKWEPSTSLSNGLKPTFNWIHEECQKQF